VLSCHVGLCLYLGVRFYDVVAADEVDFYVDCV
jgi:hypothetical protein